MKEVTEFKEKLVEYLTNSKDNYIKCEKLIKFEFNSNFDFSFAVNLEIWRHYFEPLGKYGNSIIIYGSNEQDIDEDQALQKLIKASEDWPIEIKNAKVEGGICEINLSRARVFRMILDLVAMDDFCRHVKIEGKSISLAVDDVENTSSITQFRLKTIEKVLENLIKLSQFDLIKEDQKAADYKLLLTTRSNSKNNKDSNKIIVCGVVSKDDKKISHMTAEEFLSKRQQDIHLMAIHKYGLRVKIDEEFLKLKKKLGNSAGILDMVEVKHSNVLRLTPNVKHAFILYNSARLQSILATFREKNYPPLPSLQEVNIDLLTEDGEWELLKYMLALPDVLDKSLGDVTNGKIALHTLYKYLTGFINSFSNYYSKKKILVENRPHLVPLIHAKIHFLLAIQKCLNLVLSIYDIEPVSFM